MLQVGCRGTAADVRPTACPETFSRRSSTTAGSPRQQRPGSSSPNPARRSTLRSTMWLPMRRRGRSCPGALCSCLASSSSGRELPCARRRQAAPPPVLGSGLLWPRRPHAARWPVQRIRHHSTFYPAASSRRSWAARLRLPRYRAAAARPILQASAAHPRVMRVPQRLSMMAMSLRKISRRPAGRPLASRRPTGRTPVSRHLAGRPDIAFPTGTEGRSHRRPSQIQK